VFTHLLRQRKFFSFFSSRGKQKFATRSSPPRRKKQNRTSKVFVRIEVLFARSFSVVSVLVFIDI
jgi:hypothetical protein